MVGWFEVWVQHLELGRGGKTEERGWWFSHLEVIFTTTRCARPCSQPRTSLASQRTQRNMQSPGGCAQQAKCSPVNHPEWRPSCQSPRRGKATSAIRATTFGSFVPAWNVSEAGRPNVPAVTVNASIACGLVAYGIGLHRATVGEHVNFTVHQFTHVPSTDGAAFYVRLTGPAILAGSVEGLNGTAWRVSYQAWDPGTYLLELILEYSHNAYTGPWKTDFLRGACYCNNCCTLGDVDRMRYEGYHVAGSPFVITVAPAPAVATPLPPCNPTRPLDSGRWVLCDDQRGFVSFVEARWCWRAGACTLLPVELFTSQSLTACAAGKPKRIVLIGDPIMREHGCTWVQCPRRAISSRRWALVSSFSARVLRCGSSTARPTTSTAHGPRTEICSTSSGSGRGTTSPVRSTRRQYHCFTVRTGALWTDMLPRFRGPMAKRTLCIRARACSIPCMHRFSRWCSSGTVTPSGTQCIRVCESCDV